MVVVAVNEVQNDNALLAFPNPTTGVLNVQSGFSIGEDAEVQVFNSIGECVMKRPITLNTGSGNVFTFDLSGFAQGVYQIYMSNDNWVGTTMIEVR